MELRDKNKKREHEVAKSAGRLATRMVRVKPVALPTKVPPAGSNIAVELRLVWRAVNNNPANKSEVHRHPHVKEEGRRIPS